MFGIDSAFKESVLKFTLSFILFSICLPAWCLNCSQLFTGKDRSHRIDQKIQVTSKEPIAADHMKSIYEVVASINQMVFGLLEVPQLISIEASEFSSRPVFKGYSDGVPALTLAFQYMPKKLSPKHPKYTNAVTAHEYGHALFAQNLKYFSKVWGDRFRVATESSKRAFDALEDLRTDLPRQLDLANARKTINILQAENISLAKIMFEVREIEAPYNELFADAIAVVSSNDGQAMKNALEFAGGSKESHMSARDRDFTISRRASSWKFDEEHIMMSPTRTHLWRYYLSNPKYPRKADILIALISAIGRELDEVAVNPLLANLSPAQKNQRLIDKIDMELGIKK